MVAAVLGTTGVPRAAILVQVPGGEGTQLERLDPRLQDLLTQVVALDPGQFGPQVFHRQLVQYYFQLFTYHLNLFRLNGDS